MNNFLEDYDAFSQSWWPFIITFCITIISAIRIYVGGTKCPSDNKSVGKNVIITGGSGGIGFETAKELCRRGANVILAIRNAEKGKRAIERIRKWVPNASITAKIVDLSELSSIREFADHIESEYDRIDILINNAGIIFSPFRKTVDGIELTLATNYFAPFLLTHLLLPLLSRSENGRVINVSATAHYSGKIKLEDLNSEVVFKEHDVFAQSKLALTIFSKHMASLFKNTCVTFYAVSPGLVRNTGHLKSSRLETSFFTKISVWPWVWLFLKTPKQGSQSIVYLAVEPTINNVSGCYFSECEIKEPADVVNDVALAQTLYEKSCKIVNINSEEILEKCVSKTINFSGTY